MALLRDEIRQCVASKLAELSFSNAVVAWGDSPAELKVLVGSEIKTLKIRSGMSRRRLEDSLAMLETWARQRAFARERAQTFERDPDQIDLEDAIAATAAEVSA